MKTILPGLLALAALLPATSLSASARCEPSTRVGAEARPTLDNGTEQEPAARPMRQQAQKPKITTFLWFNGEAEEAIRFYSSIFPDSKVLSESRWGEGGPMPKGTLMSARFQLAGQEFMALNGGPQFKFNEAISLFVGCDTQKEIDELWDKLGAGSKSQQCGWIQDKFGLWWQIVPNALGEMLQDKDLARAKRVTEAMLQMKKLDIAKLKLAYDGR
jgi:predicted 3-demethylubiquinone-9 3-methyltransferase (glyoxalase superfamily)